MRELEGIWRWQYGRFFIFDGGLIIFKVYFSRFRFRGIDKLG